MSMIKEYVIIDTEGNENETNSLIKDANFQAAKIAKMAASHAERVTEKAIKSVHLAISKKIAKELIDGIIKKIERDNLVKHGIRLLRIAYDTNISFQDNLNHGKNPKHNPRTHSLY